MYHLIATCPDEIVPLLKEEVMRLGGQDVKEDYRAVTFKADEKLYYKAHLELRLASRLLRVIKEIPANTPTIIFDKSKRIRFDQLFNAEDAVKIEVTGGGRESKIPVDVVGSKVREAITDCFMHRQQVQPQLSSRDATVSIKAFMRNNRLTISIDTSGKSLHKRGFRREGHPAPLKETLATALLQVIGYDGSQVLYDPMCGSGSIPIEGAMLAMKKAPMIHRKKGEFGFEHLKDFDNSLWREVCDEARQGQTAPSAAIYASDIEESFVELAKETALAARVEKYINFSVQDFWTAEKPADEGIMVVNLPYGLRLDDHQLSEDFVKKIGDHIKQNYTGWRCGFMLPESAPYKHFGLKHSKRMTILNGSVPCKFVIFDVYAGK